MAVDKIPFATKPTWAVDPIGKTLLGDEMVNCRLEGSEDGLILRRRPAIPKYFDLPQAESGTTYGQGLYWWAGASETIAVIQGVAYKISTTGTVTALTTAAGIFGTNAATWLPVTWAEGQKLDGTPILYACCGFKLGYMTSTTTGFVAAGTGAPTTASGVAYLNGRFVASEKGTNRLYFTDTDPATGLMDPTYWAAVDSPLTADKQPDDLLGVWALGDELVLWGKLGIEFWQDDGSSPFSPIPGAFVAAGLLYAQTVRVLGNSLFGTALVDGVPGVVQVAGHQAQVVSYDLSPFLTSFSSSMDCSASIVTSGKAVWYVLHNGASYSLAYDPALKYWSQWKAGFWTGVGGDVFAEREFPRFSAVVSFSSTVSPASRCYLMARTAPVLLFTDDDAFMDGEADIPINSYRRTGWLDHGSLKKKACPSMRLRVKRGQEKGNVPNGGLPTPTLTLRYRDDGSETWKTTRSIDLGTTGNRHLATVRQLGQYVTRQYEIGMTADGDLALSTVEVDVG